MSASRPSNNAPPHTGMDLIRTIEEDAEVQNFSEDSDAEVEVRQT